MCGFRKNNISKSVTIYSPIDGYVSKVNVNIGKYLNPTDILFELINPDDIHLNLKVYEKEINNDRLTPAYVHWLLSILTAFRTATNRQCP